MMRTFWWVMGAALLSSVTAWAAAAEPDRREEAKDFVAGELGERLAREVREAEREQGLSGAVLVSKDGQVVMAVGAGLANAARGQKNSPGTLFEIASLTKQFTAAAVLKLVDEGKVRLDEPIAKILPGVPEDCASITVEHLLRHTSGIPGSNSEGSGTKLEAVTPAFLRGGPKHTPGTRWEYWNQGYSLLSEVIARRGGKPYAAFCKLEVFRPAGLQSACFTGDPAPKGAVVAVGVSSMGPPRSALAHPYGREYGFQYRGMGGAVCNVWDLWRWDRALAGKPAEGTEPVLSEESRRALFTAGPGDYGLGWFVRKDKKKGRLVQSHGGAVRGFVCEMRRYPESDSMVVVLCNRDDFAVRTLGDRLEGLLFGEEVGAAPGGGGEGKADNREPLDGEMQKALVGSFKDSRGRELVVEADGKATKARIEWGKGGPTTRAVLIGDGKGGVVMDDGSGQLIGVKVDRETGASVKRATKLTILEMEFERAGE